MADFNKIALLILSPDNRKFLVCEKDNFTSDFIMPGGQIEQGESDIKCLSREIKEELDVDVKLNSLNYIGEYVDVAAGDSTKNVSIKLYQGKINGQPVPSAEIKKLHWISTDDKLQNRLSPIIINKILPDLIQRKILL
jgi:8-oxo-dGTP diphosphatase